MTKPKQPKNQGVIYYDNGGHVSSVMAWYRKGSDFKVYLEGKLHQPKSWTQIIIKLPDTPRKSKEI